MQVKQVNNFSICLDTQGRVRLPKYALWAKQAATATNETRFVYVTDIRTCAYDSFKISVFIPSKHIHYNYIGDVKKDSIASAFAKFADNMPLDAIHAPVWPIYHRDDIGQPKARRPQRFI